MKLTPDQKAGLYITVSIHLAVIIVLLVVRIGYVLKQENSFVLDFTKQEEKELLEEQEQLQREAADRLEELIAAAASVPVRNVAVDRSALKDDRGTNADELYREAERLARDLREGQNRPADEPDAFAAATPEPSPEKPAAEPRAYSGPSVQIGRAHV